MTAISAPFSGDPFSFLRSGLFTSWKDPETGVESFILSARVAPIQQSFYYVNSSFSEDGRYYWFYCGFPPSGSANQGRSLAVVDLVDEKIAHFPETAFTDASPVVDPRTGDVYWCSGLEVWKRSPHLGEPAVLVNRFPQELARNRRPWRLATHLSLSADRKSLNVDAEVGGEWYIGHFPLDGRGFVLWQRFFQCYNHGQFSPVDPGLQLIAQDYSTNPLSGDIRCYENRLWLIRRGLPAYPLFPEPLASTQCNRGDERSMIGHEWWHADGGHVWYVHYDHGLERVSIEPGSRPEPIWPLRSMTHAHADTSGTLLVCDRLADKKVTFRSQKTGREIDIVSHMPDAPADWTRYHLHPHPQFAFGNRLLCYTTTVLGGVDIAFCPTQSLESLFAD